MIELKCKSCGATLRFAPDQPCIVCQYCNAEYLREDEFVQDIIKQKLALETLHNTLQLATKQDNYAMQYKCLHLLNRKSEPLDEYQLVLLNFYECLTGKDIDLRFLNSLSKDYCDKLISLLDNIPDTYSLGNKPISKLAVEHFLNAYRDNNYVNPYKDNASMAKTKTHKRKRVKLYATLSGIVALATAMILQSCNIGLYAILAISIGLGLFVYFACSIMSITNSILHTACQSPGLPKGSMLYVYQDGFVIVKNNKPDIFLFQGIERVFLQASGVLTFILANQMTSVTIQLPNLGAVDIQKIITFANTKTKALEANYFD